MKDIKRPSIWERDRQLHGTKLREYPIEYFWYTKYRGRTVEWIIDHDVEWMIWAICNFQDVTPQQATYFKKVYGKELSSRVIQDVIPYRYEEGDPEELYYELSKTRDLESTLRRWRPKGLF